MLIYGACLFVDPDLVPHEEEDVPIPAAEAEAGQGPGQGHEGGTQGQEVQARVQGGRGAGPGLLRGIRWTRIWIRHGLFSGQEL